MSDRGDFQMLGQCRSSQQDSPRLEYIYIDPRSTTPIAWQKMQVPWSVWDIYNLRVTHSPEKTLFPFL